MDLRCLPFCDAISLIEQIDPVLRWEKGRPRSQADEWFEKNTLPGTVR